jgi:2-polyprenyl-6-methoxyphenol hydroxylase-like FAD-dependent oxidoreductase
MTAVSRDQTILIVGAGPVGLTAALELKRRGFSPRIIDKASGPAGQSRALGVNPRTLEILTPSGVTEDLLAVGNRVSRVDMIDPDAHRILRLNIDRLKHRFPFMLIVPQSETEHLLGAALEDLGVEIEWETELMDVLWHGSRVEATIATATSSETVEPDILIGADGAHSSVRELSRIAFDGENYLAVFALADIRYQLPRDASTATIEVFPGGAVGTFPIDELTFRHVGTSGDVVELVKNRRSASEVLWHSSFQVSFRSVSTYQRDRVFLAGDAAHVHSPVGARGMNLGIEDAAWLAYLIDEGREAEYTTLRRPIGLRVISMTRRQTDRLFQHSMVSHIVLRYFGKWVLWLPFVERLALKRLTGLDTPSPPWLA